MGKKTTYISTGAFPPDFWTIQQYKSPLRSGRLNPFFHLVFMTPWGYPTNLDANTRHARQRTHIFADRSFWRRARESACHSKVKNMWVKTVEETPFFWPGTVFVFGGKKKKDTMEKEEKWDERKWLYFQYDLQTVAKPFKKYLKKKGDQDYSVPDRTP